MLWVPSEVAALIKTKLTFLAVQGVGDDPLRATGAVLLDLPGAIKKVRANRSNIFRVNPRSPQPVEAWKYFQEAAVRRSRAPGDLYEEVKVGDEELKTPVLPR